MYGTRRLAAIAMVAVMVVAGGCAGWGTDGLTDGEADADDADDDLEEADGEAQADEGDSDDETDGAGADESDGDDGATGDDESSDSGDSEDADASKTGADQDEKTDETEDGDSADSNQDADTGENGGSDSDVDDSDQERDEEGDEDQDPQDGTHTLTVTVTDPDGEPVTDETVHIVTYDGGADVASAPTDDDGTAQFDLENGDYEVAVSAPDRDLYQPSDQRLVTIDGADEEFSVQLESPDDDETHTLTVTIIDRTAAGPMDGTATVDGETRDVVGDEGAEFEVDDGTYTVTGEASTDGWHVGSEEVTIKGEDREVSLPANPIRTVTVDTGEAGVDVTLVDENGDEIETKTTGDDGRVEFDALPGNYSLQADGYEPADVTVPGAHDPETVELNPDEPGTATGKVVVLDQNDEPVEGEPVTLTPPGVVEDDQKETRYTDENGEVVIELATGEPDDAVRYGVEVRDQEETLAIMADEHHGVQEVTFNIGIDPGEPNYTATGKIVVFDGEDRVEDEAVTIEYEDGSTDTFETDENGEVSLEFPKDAPDEITTVHVRVRDQTKPMIIETDEEHGVQRTVFQLEPQMTQFETTIYVENEQGERLEGEVVEARAPPGDGEWEEIGTTDENGAVVLTGQSSDPSDVIQFEVRVQGYDQEPLQTFVDDSEHEETIVIESQKTCETDFDSHHEAQSYFEEAPLERGHLDKDNDGVACEDHTSPDAKAIVIVEDEDGNPAAGKSVMIDGQSVETNEAGAASMTFDFGGESGSETIDISVRDEEMTLTVENDQGGYLDEKSNIVEITVEPAAQEAVTAGSQEPVAVML